MITAHKEGCLLCVRAQPGARRNAIMGVQAGALKVSVTAPPEDGKANQAILELLREQLGLKRSQIELYSGMTNRQKQFLIREYSVSELEGQIKSLVSE